MTERNDGPERSKPLGGLWLVATPIGNLADITERALSILRAADRIACEDTRHTGRLLAHFGIRNRLVPYHEHNAAQARPRLLGALQAGETVALVSDAGMPLISDPGYKLVRAAIDAGHAVSGCPGPSAPLLALALSGLSPDTFYFGGFLPPKKTARIVALEALVSLRTTLILFESPRRLGASLEDMATVLGTRQAAVARELTKRFEHVRRGSLPELAAHYAAEGAPKGEIVIVIGPPGKALELDESEIDARLDALLAGGSVRDAATALAAETGIARRTLYSRAMERAHQNHGDRKRGDQERGDQNGET